MPVEVYDKYCFELSTLRAFDSGSLTDPSLEESIAQHLEICPSCSDQLEAIAKSEDPILCWLREVSPIEDAISFVKERSSGALPANTTTASLAKPNRLAGRAPNGDQLPVRIDRYFVIRRLGSGAFGEVYLAKDPEHNRLVAIKVQRSDRISSPEYRNQFLSEARTSAALSHPNIVPVYDFREQADGRCIIVMQFIDGPTLRELHARESIDPRRVAEIVADVADALHFAHRRGIVHRDVTPRNILINERGQPLLTDFGLALHVSQQHPDHREMAGTYPYMSPEQIRGDSHALNAQSDIWSLGVVFYELLAGRRPFAGSRLEELRNLIEGSEPAPILSLNSQVSPELAIICQRCLAKDPKRRYSSAAELANSLRIRSETANRRTRRALPVAAFCAVIAITGVFWATRKDDPQQNPPLPTVRNDSYVGLTPIAWPSRVTTDFYGTPDATGGFAVKSTAASACFQTHRPTWTSYYIESDVTFQDDIGVAGVVFGIHATSRQPDHYRCYVLFVGRNFPDDGKWLTLQDCQIMGNELKHRRTLFKENVSDLADRDSRIRIDIRKGRIERAICDNHANAHLDDELARIQVPHNTGCGVLAMSHVVFHSVQVAELE